MIIRWQLVRLCWTRTTAWARIYRKKTLPFLYVCLCGRSSFWVILIKDVAEYCRLAASAPSADYVKHVQALIQKLNTSKFIAYDVLFCLHKYDVNNFQKKREKRQYPGRPQYLLTSKATYLSDLSLIPRNVKKKVGKITSLRREEIRAVNWCFWVENDKSRRP